MGRAISQMVADVQADTLAARIKHELNKLEATGSQHPHRIADVAKANIEPLRAIADLTTEYLAKLIGDQAYAVGADFDSKYFRDALSDLVSEALSPMKAVAESVHELEAM